MARARRFAVTGAFGAVAWLLGCEPQVVDVVDPVDASAMAGAGGLLASGGSAGSGGRGGSAGGCTGPCCDTTKDRDSDGTPDCDDACPDNPNKIAPGVCGCYLPEDDESEPGVASCSGLLDSLVHRYSFNGSGAVVTDSLGGPDGTVVNAELSGDGTVALEGRMTDEYVDLPNGILSVLDSVTLETWLTWYGGNEWQRIFDFGDGSSGVEDEQSPGGFSYLFLTPHIPDSGGGFLRVAYQRNGAGEIQLDAPNPLYTAKVAHVAVTFDASSETLSLYLDGVLQNSNVFGIPVRMSEINDINNWLGRSQFVADAELGGRIEEFRIYSAALNADQIRTSFSSGPNPDFLTRMAN